MTTIFFRLAKEGRIVVRFDQIKEVPFDEVKNNAPAPCPNADRVDPFVEDGYVFGWVHSRKPD